MRMIFEEGGAAICNPLTHKCSCERGFTPRLPVLQLLLIFILILHLSLILPDIDVGIDTQVVSADSPQGWFLQVLAILERPDTVDVEHDLISEIILIFRSCLSTPRITHVGLTCEQIMPQVTGVTFNHHIHINHNDDDHQNPTYYRVGEKVKDEPKRSTTANQLDNRLIIMMITMMMMMMILVILINQDAANSTCSSTNEANSPGFQNIIC